MTRILHDAYERLWGAGRAFTRKDVERDVNRLFRANFEKFTGLDKGAR
jgi:hypothetical protein